MKRAADTKRVLITMPGEVREYLQERAVYNGSSLSAEVVRNAREKMEKEGAAAAKAVATAE
jgi:hypothetical protein